MMLFRLWVAGWTHAFWWEWTKMHVHLLWWPNGVTRQSNIILVGRIMQRTYECQYFLSRSLTANGVCSIPNNARCCCENCIVLRQYRFLNLINERNVIMVVTWFKWPPRDATVNKRRCADGRRWVSRFIIGAVRLASAWNVYLHLNESLIRGHLQWACLFGYLYDKVGWYLVFKVTVVIRSWLITAHHLNCGNQCEIDR